MGPKKKGHAARTRYMIADFTREEKDRVINYCKRNHTTISSFLATVALEDVHRANREGPTEEEVDITLRIPAEQSAKLHTFARLQGKTVNQFVAGLVTEHRLLREYLKSKNLSARTYISYLALKALERRKKK